MVVAGRMLPDGDVAIMMVEAESTTGTLGLLADGQRRGRADRGHRAEGLEAAKPFLKLLCEAQQQVADQAAKPTAEFPVFAGLPAGRLRRRGRGGHRRAGRALTIAGKQERETETDRVKALARRARQPVRGPGEGDQRAPSVR